MLRMTIITSLALFSTELLAAQIAKITRTRAIVTVASQEIKETIEVGDRIYLVDGFGNHSPMSLEKIEGEWLTLKGNVEKLEMGLKYDVAFVPSAAEEPHKSPDAFSAHESAGMRLSLSSGKRWTSHDGEGVLAERLVEVAFGGKLSGLPLGLYGYLNQSSGKFVTDSEQIKQNSYKGLEYGVRLELSQVFSSFEPFFAIRLPWSKESTEAKLRTSRSAENAQRIESTSYEFKGNKKAHFDLGFHIHATKGFSVFLLAAESSRETVRIKADTQTILIGSNSGTTQTLTRTKGSFIYDEVALGIAWGL